MKIIDILKQDKPAFSFEFFPPKDNDGFDKLFLRTYLFNNPEFQDVWEDNNVKSRIKYIDTMRFAQKLISSVNSYSLKSLCKYFNIEQLNAHRAEDDTKSMITLYEKLCEGFGCVIFQHLNNENNVKVVKYLMARPSIIHNYIYKM